MLISSLTAAGDRAPSHAENFFRPRNRALGCQNLARIGTLGKRGPEGFVPTKAQREKVKLYLAGGISEPVVAHRLGISQNTLRKHFADELEFGRDMKRADNLERLEKAATKGNVSAMKHLDAKFATVSAENSFTAPAPRSSDVGKKEQAQAAAKDAGQGTGWGDDLSIPAAKMN